MKLLLLLLLLLVNPALHAASSDSIPTHLAGLRIPDFKLLLTDSSSYFYTEQLDRRKYTLIMMFSPDCDHCHRQTEGILRRIEAFRHTQIVMTTVLPMKQLRQFSQTYQLQRYRNITVGQDVLHFFSRYYRARYTPYLALYNQKGELLQVYDGEVPMADLEQHLPQRSPR